MFSAQQFVAFTGNVGSGEEKLLSYDFCFGGTSESQDEKHTYYKYRINHSYNPNTNLYAFDSFFIVDNLERVEFQTSSNKNYIAYKKKLINYGFSRITDDLYEKKTGSKTYYMQLSRVIHKSSGTPNYNIKIFAI